MSEQDQEVTLGTGRLLGLFFGLVIVCAVFFSLGFSLGRRSAPEPVAAAGTTALASTGAGPKPSPGRSDSTAKPNSQEGAARSSADELTFYKAVEQNEPKAKLDKPAAEHDAATPEMTRPVSLGAGYIVQVAAVSKQEDADALVNALRKKSYPVIATNGPTDKLYHVQVGPFPDLKDAEATRSKLIGDGYNPILKK